MNKPKFSRSHRFLWYQQVIRCQRTVKETCQIFGISRKTYYHWLLKDYGSKGNTYLPLRSQPNLKLTFKVRKFIEEQKLKTNYGPKKMKWLVKRKLNLDLSTTLIYRYYRRKHLIRKPQKKLPWYEPLKEALIIEKQGQGVQMDVKYIWEKETRKFQYSVFDPFTCKYYFQVFSTKESANAIRVLVEAQRYFGFKIVSIQTDNGSEFRGNFHVWLLKHGLPHYFIPKSSPYWNAQVERVHRTIDDEYYLNPLRAWKTSAEWLHYYNFERLHETLNGLTPQEKVLQCVTLDC